MSANQFQNNFFQQTCPQRVYNTSAASGTYQAAADDRLKLHVICSPVDIYINWGTGSSVSVATTNGHYVMAGTQFQFHLTPDRESIGWVTADGNAGRVTISTASR